MPFCYLGLSLGICGLGAGTGRAQSSPADALLLAPETEFHLVAGDTKSLTLAHPFIALTTFRAVVAGQEWIANRDYQLKAREGVWIPLRPLPQTNGAPVLVVFSYQFAPVTISPRLDLNPVATAPPALAQADSSGLLTTAAATAATAGGELTVHGSKTVQVSQGNRREVTVDQNLRLFVSGQLTPDISIQATLTDDDLPVVPEGNTEELKDVDKILIQLKAPHWEATLGDFIAESKGSRFSDFRRKLQGFSFVARPGPLTLDALAGSPRGVYRVLQIRGEETNQGPYFLGDSQQVSNLFIVAGSERVTLDGERMVRGADNDYVIDYIRGTVTFTYRRLITAESTIVVEFEVGESPYERTTIGAGGAAAFTVPGTDGVAGNLGVRLQRERDDPQRLRGGELSEQDLEVLAAAGDDSLLAVAPGATEVEPGEGQYRQELVDTRAIYVWDGEFGNYNVDFFFAGSGQGNYGLDSLTVAGERAYSYRGEGEGSYRVGRLLPLPRNHQMVTVATQLGSPDGAYLKAEWNLSELDPNQLSERDDADDHGQAWAVDANLGETEFELGAVGPSRVAFQGWYEQRDLQFRPFLLRKDRFAYDRWGLGSRASGPGFLEDSDSESQLSASWLLGQQKRQLRLSGQWGHLNHGGDLRAFRRAADARWRFHGGEGKSSWEQAVSRDKADPLDIKREFERHEASWGLVLARPSLFIETNQWVDDAKSDSVTAGYRLQRWGAGLGSLPDRSWSWKIAWSRDLADSLQGQWQRKRDSRTSTLGIAAPPVVGMRLVADATLRTIVAPDLPDQTTRLAKATLNGNWLSLGSDWSLGYSVDNSRTQVLARRIIFVGQRQGDYDEVGNFVGRNNGDYTVAIAGTDSLVVTTTVKADLDWRQDFGFLGRDRIWGAWTSRTDVAVTASSRSDDINALLRLDPEVVFDEDEAVLGQVSLQEEIALLRHWRWIDLRLRYDYSKAVDRQYVNNPENRQRRFLQGTLTLNTTQRTSLRLRTNRTLETRLTPASSLSPQQSYDAVTRLYESEFSLRPSPGNRLALAGEAVQREDAVTQVSQKELALIPTARLRLHERWTANAQLRYAEVTSDEPPGVVRPFFFSQPGRNIQATTRLEWDPTRFLTVALFYVGQRQGEGGWQHDVRLESTARF